MHAWRDALEAMAALLAQESPAMLSFSLAREVQDALPFYWRKFKVIPGYTYLLDLSSTIGEIEANMASVRRRNLSKASRDGLSVRRIADLSVVHDLVLATFDRQDVRISRHYIERILFDFANEFNSFAFATYRDNTPIACTFVVHDRVTAYYLLGGYTAGEKHHGAGPLAMFAAIMHAKGLGLAAFDFEGSMIPTIERYFRGFGGRLTPYFTVNKAWLPIEIVLKFIKRESF